MINCLPPPQQINIYKYVISCWNTGNIWKQFFIILLSVWFPPTSELSKVTFPSAAKHDQGRNYWRTRPNWPCPWARSTARSVWQPEVSWWASGFLDSKLGQRMDVCGGCSNPPARSDPNISWWTGCGLTLNWAYHTVISSRFGGYVFSNVSNVELYLTDVQFFEIMNK